ncbi:hypothetical protein M8C21_013340, partial [Ambrosia artemisiifolia]
MEVKAKEEPIEAEKKQVKEEALQLTKMFCNCWKEIDKKEIPLQDKNTHCVFVMYLGFVHGSYLKQDHVLRNLLVSLPIKKVIFSNANDAHVAAVIGQLGLEDCFDDVICFESLNPKIQTVDTFKGDDEPVGLLPNGPVICKPSENAFQEAFKMAKINPHK